jgi:hypothetical protein
MDFILSMGFEEDIARSALNKSNGNVEAAVELLLSGATFGSEGSEVSVSRQLSLALNNQIIYHVYFNRTSAIWFLAETKIRSLLAPYPSILFQKLAPRLVLLFLRPFSSSFCVSFMPIILNPYQVLMF